MTRGRDDRQVAIGLPYGSSHEARTVEQSRTSKDADVPCDLGVLFVHGIGQSRQGETLIRFGEPLREAIEELAIPSTSSTMGGSPASSQVSVTAAWSGEALGELSAPAELENG